MNDRTPIVLALTLATALGCGDSTGETADEGSSSGVTTGGPTTGPTIATTTDADSTGTTEVTSVDSTSTEATTVGGDAEIEVSIAARPVASGDAYELSDPVDVGAMGDAVTVTIDNIGGSDLSIASVVLGGGDVDSFVLDDSGLAAVVAPGASTSVTVALAPGNGGRKSTLLTIDNDDADEGTYAIDLRARTTPNTYRELLPATAPSPRFNTALAATDDGRVVLLGGRGADSVRLADTWVYDVEANEWTELLPTTAPGFRDAHDIAYVGGGLVVLFGGNATNGPTPMPFDDTWVLDLATGEWTELMPAASPPARFQHAMVGTADGVAILYGGRVEFGVELSDTWMFDPTTQTWTDLAPASAPGPRSAFPLVYDGIGTLAITGGTVNSSALTDETWLYDIAGNDWTMVAATDQGVRFTHVGAWLEAGVVTFSGKYDVFENPVAGTWLYDATADAWSDLAPATEPAPRLAARMVSVGNDKAILFGGLLVNADNTSAVNETWEYVGP
ncbi:kelch repeat-containing protein [Paraliomyxa miuraensis]|uniref:kelch repeat-containing protein n=1 Tax=Paraliomyxa miuraensis TaxID=376150 RepID=UPI0022598FA7|nr:kelch repeat-containing protein [Paraliomyxa miuraensis]MCX4241698.1 hypothetical protein [Paraliomyxa miuraensis]